MKYYGVAYVEFDCIFLLVFGYFIYCCFVCNIDRTIYKINGFLSKQIAKTNKNIKVIGFEHFITPFIYSKINNMFVKNVKIKRENFFNYLDKSDKKFDIGVAYLYPDLIARLEKYKHKFDIIILLDFNFKNTIESKKIKLNKNLLGQHNMFVYDFTKK